MSGVYFPGVPDSISMVTLIEQLKHQRALKALGQCPLTPALPSVHERDDRVWKWVREQQRRYPTPPKPKTKANEHSWTEKEKISVKVVAPPLLSRLANDTSSPFTDRFSKPVPIFFGPDFLDSVITETPIVYAPPNKFNTGVAHAADVASGLGPNVAYKKYVSKQISEMVMVNVYAAKAAAPAYKQEFNTEAPHITFYKNIAYEAQSFVREKHALPKREPGYWSLDGFLPPLSYAFMTPEFCAKATDAVFQTLTKARIDNKAKCEKEAAKGTIKLTSDKLKRNAAPVFGGLTYDQYLEAMNAKAIEAEAAPRKAIREAIRIKTNANALEIRIANEACNFYHKHQAVKVVNTPEVVNTSKGYWRTPEVVPADQKMRNNNSTCWKGRTTLLRMISLSMLIAPYVS
jgi:hypothetical protein